MSQHTADTSARGVSLLIRGGVLTPKIERTWAQGKICAAIDKWTGRDAEIKSCNPRHVLLLTLSGASTYTETRISDSVAYTGRDAPGCVTFVPAATERLARYQNSDLNSISLYVDPDFVQFSDVPQSSELLPFTNRRDPLVESLLWSFSREMQRSGADLPSLYAEHTVSLALLHLIRAGGAIDLQIPLRETLSKAKLNLVLEFIEEGLNRDLSLSELGAVADMAPNNFARSFKSHMGLPPYRYVTRRRMQRAADLLAEGKKSIAEIALDVGFSSQSNFTSHFGRVFNKTPAAYRTLYRA